MKLKYILLFALLFIPIFGFSQKKYSYEQGSRFIRKAEKDLAKDNYKKTRKYIEKAKKSIWGFCGLGSMATQQAIVLIEIELLNKQKKYDEAFIIMDSLKQESIFESGRYLDSLEVKTLILKYGKEKVKNAFSKVETYETVQNNDIFYINVVYLEDLDYKFYFSFSFRREERYDTSKPKLFIEEARHHSFYSLLID